MKLRFLNGPQQGRIVDIEAKGLSIGRDRDNGLVIEDDGISRRHCRFTLDGDTVYVEDAGSTNGVRVNGRRIAAREAVRRGDHVGLGPFVLQVTDTGDLIDAAALPPAPEPVKPPVLENRPRPVGAKDPFPWAQAILLVVLLFVFAGLAYITFFAPPPGPPATGGTPPAEAPGMASAPDPLVDTLPGEESPVAAPAPAADLTTAPAPPPDTGSEPAPPAPAPEPAAAPPEEGPLPAGTASAIPVIAITTEPAGATLKLDGVDKGVTPVYLRDLPAGRHTISLTLDGYETLDRQIHYPSLVPDRPYVLRQRPGTLLISSTPAGAAVQYGARILGVTPLLVDELPPGEYEFRLLSVSHDPARVKGKVSELRPETVTVALQSRLGNLELVTYPAGCDVFLDGTLAGRTQAAAPEAREARPLLVSGLLEGEHDVLIQHPLGVEDRGKVIVARGETRRVARRLWILDTELVLIDGSKRYGMWVEKNAMGDITLAETSKKMERYLKPQIAKVNALTAEQSRELMEKKTIGGLRSGDRPATPTPLPPETAVPPAGPPERSGPAVVAAKPVAEAPHEGAGETDGPALEGTVSVEQLATVMRASTATRLKQLYRDRALTVSGVPATFGGDRTTAYVNLGSRLRFEFPREQFDAIKDQIAAARDERQPLLLRGTVADYTATGFIFRDCALVDGAAAAGDEERDE